jgi:hypothetical protein
MHKDVTGASPRANGFVKRSGRLESLDRERQCDRAAIIG